MLRNVLTTACRILVVCLVFAGCFLLGAALSGLDRIGQQVASAQAVQQVSLSVASARPQLPPMPANFLPSLLLFCFCAGIVLSYLILRSRWHGWTLTAAVALAIYGISTLAAQIESAAFLTRKLPHGMLPALFLQGAIMTALFAPLAVLVLGRWRATSAVPDSAPPLPRRASSALWRLATLVVAFVFLYMFFGYYIAWQNPALRQFYGGPQYPSFYAALKANWMNHSWIYPLQVFRALLFAACMYPLIRMLRASRGEKALAMALFLSVWTVALLLPNPLMPPAVAHSHFYETLGFSLIFGALAGWLLSSPAQTSSPGDSIHAPAR